MNMANFRRAHGVCAITLAVVLASPVPSFAQTYHSQTETITYHDNPSKWVLGQVSKRVVNGVTVSEATFDSTNALPLTHKSFGKLQQTLTHDTASTVASGQRGTVKTVKDGRNNVTTLGNWKRGIPQSITHADGKAQSAVVNNDSTIASVTDENGYKTCYAYDAMGRLSRVTYPSESSNGVCDTSNWNATTQAFEQVNGSEYGIGAGHWRQTVATGNGRLIRYFDALWRPLVVREYDTGNVSDTQRFTRFAYDHEGRVTFASYPSTASNPSTGTRTTYDALGRVTKVVQDSELGVLTTTTSYLNNDNGYYTRVTDPKGNQTRTWYQAFDQPSYDTPVTIWHPEGAYTHITRDVFGKPTKIRRSNSSSPTGGTVALNRHYLYGGAQRLCMITEPETGSEVVWYDGAENLVRSVAGLTIAPGTSCADAKAQALAAGRSVIRTYDARNRIESLSFPDNRGNTTHSYWPDGLPKSIEVDNGDGNIVTTTYNYNRRRLLTSERMNWNALAWTLGTGYNANGHVASHSYPAEGSVSYAPNALGQPTRVGSYVTDVSYHPNGAPKQFTYGNGIVHSLTQNTRGLPDSRTDAYGSTRFLDDGYDYDGNGNVAAITDGATGRNQRGNRDMTYDGLDRLTATTSPMFGTATYAYDVLDNLTGVKLSGGTAVRDHAYCYDSNWRLTNVKIGSCGGSTVIGLGYDAQGNLNNRNGVSFNFDYGNRLRSTSASNTSYVYDGLGRRVRDLTGASKYSLYNQAGQLMFAADHRKKLNTSYFYLGSRLVAKNDRSTVAPTGVPTLTVPGTNSTGAFTASWTQVAIAERYELEQRKDGGGWSQIYSGINLSKALSGLTAGTYEHQVRACTAAGCAAFSEIKPTVVTLPPGSPPSTFTVPPSNNTGSYTVSWSTVGTATRYELDEQVNGGGWTQLQNTSATSRNISGKGNGSYGYRVRACNAVGCSGYTAAKTTVVTLPPGSPPSTFTVPASNNTGSYTVSWSTVSTATRYELDEQVNGGGWTQLQNTSATSRNISGKGNGSYGYRVRACNAVGCSVYTATKTTVVTKPPSSPPSTFTVPASNNTGSYTVSWSTVGTATRYELDEQVNGGGWTQLQNTSATSRGISGKGNGSYGYRVRACNVGGCSNYSTTKTTVVTHPPGSAPTLNAPSSTGQGYNFTWTAVATATRYELEQSPNGGSNWYVVYNGPDRTRTVQSVDGQISYRVRACNVGGCGPYSNIRTVWVYNDPDPCLPGDICNDPQRVEPEDQ